MKSKFNDITEKHWTKLDERMGYIGDARIYVDDNKENNITDEEAQKSLFFIE